MGAGAEKFNPSIRDKLSAAGTLLRATVKHPEGVIDMFKRGETPMAASIDIAANCNLRCQHCYLYEKGHQEEGIDDPNEFLAKVREMRDQNPGIVHVTWVGGEPMWRKEVLRETVKIFPTNWVITNGTIPVDGEWQNTAFFISIDGTETIHNQIRQPWKQAKRGLQALPLVEEVPEQRRPGFNIYRRAKDTARTATAPVYVHSVINKLNAGVIPELVDEWYKEGNVRGFAFSLHTPMIDQARESGMTENDERLFLSDEERTKVVVMLLALKKQYGKFIAMSDGHIKNYLPERQLEVFGDKCRIVNGVISVDAKFNRKFPCVMGNSEGVEGNEMDCSKCGCAVPALVDRIARFDFESSRLAFNIIAASKAAK